MVASPTSSSTPALSALSSVVRLPIIALIFAVIYIRHVLVSWFFFKPLFLDFNGKPCIRERPDQIPRMPFVELVRLRLLWLIRIWTPFSWTKVHDKLDTWHYSLIEQVEGYVETNFELQKEMPIPRFDWQNKSPDEFYEQFVKTPMPVVLEGFALETEAVKTWDFDHILDRCGEVNLQLTTADSDYIGQLKEVRDPNIYCANADAIFKAYPELVDALDIPKVKPYIKHKHTLSQFFIGKQRTGSGYHCAGVWNFFYMISGEKKWTFVDPEFSWMMYPMMNPGAIAFASLVSFPEKNDLDSYRLYKYCPRYSVVLKPGDVLLNPPWWWHTIDNLTETSVAVATRWDTIATDPCFYEVNRMMSLLSVFNRRFPGFTYNFLVTQSDFKILRGATPVFDEHSVAGGNNQASRATNAYQGRVSEKVKAKRKW